VHEDATLGARAGWVYFGQPGAAGHREGMERASPGCGSLEATAMTSSTNAPGDRRWFAGIGGELEFDALVAPGTVIRWDPADPHRSAAFPTGGAVRAGWLRLAALHALDFLLHLPLDQSLVAGEIAVAEHAAARTLPDREPLREHLVASALGRAREASAGVRCYLEHLVVGETRPPRPLEAVVERLAVGYDALGAEVREPDAELSAVTEAWQRLSLLDVGGASARPPLRSLAPVCAVPGADDHLDPRRVRGRLVRMGSTTDTAEIEVVATHWKGRPAVRVRVAAFGDELRPADAADLGVRLVDRRSGQVCSHGLLGGLVTAPPRSLRDAGDRYFEGIVELPDALTVEDVRVELSEADGDGLLPPAGDDELHRVRRATLFLSGWRALVADVRLYGDAVASAERLREITGRVLPGSSPESATAPLWAGGPSALALHRLAARGDRVVAALAVPGRRLRHPRGVASVAAMVSGPGDLLVAEIAAAYERCEAE
jgi:hypothetical protein